MANYRNQLCVVCKRQNHSEITNSSHYGNQAFKIFGVYSTYLKEKLFSKSHKWESLSEFEKQSPFCTDCFYSGEKLCALDNQLKNIKKEINSFLKPLIAKILKCNGIDDPSRNFDWESLSQETVGNAPDNLDLNDFYSNIGCSEDSFDPENNDTGVEMKIFDSLEVKYDESSEGAAMGNSLRKVKQEIPEVQTAYVLLERLEGLESNYIHSLRNRPSRLRSGKRKRTHTLRRDVTVTTTSTRKKHRKQKFELRQEDTEEQADSEVNEDETLNSTQDPADKPIFECVPCEATFPSETALNVHINKHGDKKLKCNLCGKPFHTKWLRRTHKLKVHGIEIEKRPVPTKIKSFKKCEICGQDSFTSKYEYEVHILAHNEEIPFQCQFCLKMFSNIAGYEKHQVNSDCPVTYRSESDSFPCDYCERTFKAKYILLVHISVDHHVADKGFDCTLCQQKFFKIPNLEKHAAKHTLESQFMCDICGMSLRGHVSLSEHRYTHKTTASFECKYCNAGFKTRNALARHLLVHGTPGQTWKCDHCGIELKNKTDLKRHVATHFKHIICDVCGKAFNRNVDLKTHYRIHTGELFACTGCDKKFVSQYLLTQHIASVHYKIKAKADRVIKSRVKRSVDPSIETK